MKRKYIALWVVLVFIIRSCQSSKNITVTGSGKDGAIQTVITNFSKIHRLYKPDSVFSLRIKKIPNNNDVLVVNIIRAGGKLLFRKDYTVGTRGKLPSRYFEKDDKLFYWWDDDIPLTEEVLTILRKYNLLQDDENGLIQTPTQSSDDSQKGVHYYFCKDNLRINKRIITNIGLGYYEPPKLKCER